jgi:hypothetical protein
MTVRRNSILPAFCAAIVFGTLASAVIAAKKPRPVRKPVAAASATPNGSSASPPAAPVASGRASPSPAAAAKSERTGKDPRDAKPETTPRPAQPQQPVARQESRIEFDERMVRGQSASGVIYLFQRSPSEFKSIVQVPETFRPRTVEVLAPRRDQP